MNGKFRNVWVDIVFQQICCVRLATVVAAQSFEICWQLGPQSLCDHCLPRSSEPLDPMEFHGRRRSASPRSPQIHTRQG